MKRIITRLVVGLACATAPAFAADSGAVLSAIEGEVLVSRGEGFVAVTGDQVLVTGDRVMLMDGANATLSWPSNGCAFAIPEKATVTVQTAEQCAIAQANATASQGAATGATGTGAGLSTGTVVGIAAGVGVVAAAAGGGGGGDDDDDDEQPVSP